jgi:hypothetical protein
MTVSKPLSELERDRLAVLEDDVRVGLSTFLMVGNALAEIQAGELYRGTHTRFDEYLRDRWQLGKSRAYQLIEASTVAGGMDDPPPTESHARALAGIPADARDAVYGLLKTLGGVTADEIKALAKTDLSAVLGMAGAEPEFLVMVGQLVREAGDGKPTATVVRSLAAVYHGIRDSGAIDGPDGESIAWLDASPEQRRAFLMANLDAETFERQQRHRVSKHNGSLSGMMSDPMVDRVTIPKKQYEDLLGLALSAPTSALEAYARRWGDTTLTRRVSAPQKASGAVA